MNSQIITVRSNGEYRIEGEIHKGTNFNLDISQIDTEEAVAAFLASKVTTSYHNVVSSLVFSGSQLSDKASYR
jgi:hypothetical protein